MSTQLSPTRWAPIAAVVTVAVLAGALLASPRTAEAVAVAGTSTPFSAVVWNSSTVPTTNPGVTITEPSATAWAATDTVVITHTGITSSAAAGATCTNCTIAYGANTTTLTITAVTGGVDTVAIDRITFAVTASGAPATISVTVGSGASAAGTITTQRMVLGTNSSTTVPAVINRITATFSADTAAAGGAICAFAADASGVPMVGLPINFSVSLGVVSTGTSKTATALTGTGGGACTNYRGGGGIASTDTAIASNSSQNIVDTLSITLTAPTGNTASKMTILAPSDFAIAPNVTNVSPGYSSPMVGSNVALQVTDASGLGVNSQVLLVTVDRGAVIANPVFATNNNTVCTGVTQKSLTLTSNATNLNAPGGTANSGYVNFTVCGNQSDQPGNITITAQNISTSMANATQVITQAGRPNKITATVTSNQITVRVTDSGGNPVADGTPVRFTLSQNAGAVSAACTTTSNGSASSAVALVQSSGSVIVSADYNETGTVGTAATCAAPGAQQIAATVAVGSGGGTGGTGGQTGAGTFASTPVFSVSGLSQVVFNGGSVGQLDAAITAAGVQGSWAQSANGQFHLNIVGGGFVNDDFRAAFPNGFSGVTAMTLVKIR